MNKIKRFTIFSIFLFLYACSSDSNKEAVKIPVQDEPESETENVNDKNNDKETVEPELESNDESVNLSKYFMKDQSVANYLGEGNEYATFTARTQWHDDHTVSIFENNGGTILLRTFRITENAIEIINEQGEFYGEFNPTSEELSSLPVISNFLKLPLEKGNEFDGWTIIDVGLTVDTPLQKFEEVIQIQKIDETGSIQNKFIVENYGEIKREFIINEEDVEFSVTSTIETIE